MFTPDEITRVLVTLGISHVVWVPDSALGPWEAAFEAEPSFELIRACREGEAWAIAAGLHLGGRQPLVMIQCTGLFESGDALRNVLFDLKLPLYAMIGYRSYLVEGSPDTARRYVEPILDAWGLDHVLITSPEENARFSEHYRTCRAENRPGATLVAEGRM
jgi:sulfopyruvate decarboxylase TPP-binding subunit